MENIKKEENKKKKNKKSNEIYLMFGAMISLVVIFFLFYSIFSRMNKFEYEGLTFTKEKFGELPLFHYYYYFNTDDGKLIKYNLFLRKDPRENKVPIIKNYFKGDIIFKKEDLTYISVDPEGLVNCDYASASIATLSSFLIQNQIKIKSASPNKKQANLSNVNYINCENNTDNTVIIIKKGEKTKITYEKENCYVLEVNNCEMIDVVEKFEVQSILDAKKNSKPKISFREYVKDNK